jgi:hypothetical protein
MLVHLQSHIESYYSQLLNEHGFRQTNNREDGMGALIQFENDDFGIRFINDRGIIDVDLFSLIDKEYLFHTELLEYLVKVEDGLIADKWSEKMALTKVSSAEERVVFLQASYRVISSMLSSQNFLRTKIDIEATGEKRSDVMFPKG